MCCVYAEVCFSLQMLEDHLSEKALIPALRFVAENHPQRLAKSAYNQEQQAKDDDRFEGKLMEIVLDNTNFFCAFWRRHICHFFSFDSDLTNCQSI